MELTQLKYFLTTANCGKITQAAELLHVSQSAVSMSISRLEEELQVKLFEKNGRNITLTENGRRFIALISPAMAELDYALMEMQIHGMSERNTIRLSVEMPDFATYFETSYHQSHPNVLFAQSMDNMDQAKHKVINCSVDFCIGMAPIDEPNVENLLLFSEDVYIQLSNSHPLFNRESLHLFELADSTFVSFSKEYGFRAWMDRMCKDAGFRPKTYFESCDTQSLLRYVSQMGAVTFIGESTVVWAEYSKTEFARMQNQIVNSIPLLDDFAKRDVYLIYNKNRVLSEECKTFLACALRLRDQYAHSHNILTAMDFS